MIKAFQYWIGFVLIMFMIGNCAKQDAGSVVATMIYLFAIGTDWKDIKKFIYEQ